MKVITKSKWHEIIEILILLWVAGFLSLLTIAMFYFCSLLIKGGSHSGYALQMHEQEFGYEIIRARRQMNKLNLQVS